ncbi:MAG: biotin/lipoyl-binding protein [Bosea sp. (in: a-proteobacteria)]
MVAANPGSQQSGQPAAAPWPVVRADLRIEPAEPDHLGCPAIAIHDPSRASYFRLAWPASEAFLSLSAGSTEAVMASVRRRTGLELDEATVAATVEFATRHQLVRADATGAWRSFAAMLQQQRHGILGSLVHSYLFFRVPLLRPDTMLVSAVAMFRRWPLKLLATLYLMALSAGLYLLSHQMDAFLAVMVQTARLDAVWTFAAALFLLKIVHETGHAITTAWHGCKVPTVGVAFMMGAPVLYTDTTDAWRLPSRSKRLGIVGAGVAAEMVVAGLALMLWPFLPHGLPQQLACAFATTSIATTVLVNLNPLMRFDGYFALSDTLRMPNLQARAFAYGRWRLRETLFDLREPPPEDLSPPRAAIVLTYAYLAWVYRLVLFLGIAWVVYSFVVKLLGVALFLFEIIFFVARPLAREVAVWWGKRQDIVRRKRSVFSACLLLAGTAVLIAPWEARVELPAMLGVADEVPLHVPVPARFAVLLVTNGSRVRAGDVIARFDAPHLEAQAAKIDSQIVAIAARLARTSASEADREGMLILESQLRHLQVRRATLEIQRRDLSITAPFDGIVTDLDPHLRPGMFQSPSTEIARLVRPGQIRVRGLVDDVQLARIEIGARGRFIADNAMMPSIDLYLESISVTNEPSLLEHGLADIHGGQVAVSEERNQLVPRLAHFGLTLSQAKTVKVPAGSPEGLRGGSEPDSPQPPGIRQQVRGIVVLEAQAESYAKKVIRKVSQVLAKEQGF